nr:DUF72 domain-containing protein [Bacteriovorax sp. HI3]
MEFGKLENIDSVDSALPTEDPGNASRVSPGHDFTLRFGSPAWGAKHWLGKIYPPKTPPQEFLYHYSRNFNCIELNTTHYRIPDSKTISEWLLAVPADFQFCPKLHKDISHARNGLVDTTILSHWWEFLSGIQNNLGPCFIQFHEMFSYKDKMLLFRFLENWPSEFKLSLELRHPSWFQNGVILPALADYLNRKNIGLVITDVAGRRDVLHSTLSTDWTLIRLIGNNLHESDERRLGDWALRIKEWQKLGLRDCYLFLHQPDDIKTIEFSTLAEEVFTQMSYENVPHFKLEQNLDLLSLI